ncbi:hypothetical protein dsx2_1816 [Desulfovibrio sp. X2]|uniref:hypothetical protein n=1 Tax=Desulfovibrio sp. X2 TaxID=941449 RepID=UPI000358A706|nr:hypothetical protein [Desulfovibrio sp. X2]EPR44072.1 hypothetical protein dsx2_1816 [Desulfovibrio sp. X2]
MTENQPPLDLSFSRSARDMAATALVLAFLALIVAGAFFITSRNSNNDLRAASASLTQRVDGLENRLASVEALPRTLRRQAAQALVEEMSLRAKLLDTRLDDPAQKETLAQVEELLEKLRQAGQEPGAQ